MNKNYFLFKEIFAISLKTTKFHKNVFGKLSLLLVMFISLTSNAQVTVDSGGQMNLTYPTLAAAIVELNDLPLLTGPITITLTGNETAPAGGYIIKKTGFLASPIVIKGVSSTITAFSPQSPGVLFDGIFKIQGGDWITIEGFTMIENPANTTIAAATNNMTEWGVAILQDELSVVNGCQNITILNNSIDLNRTYVNTFGIYSNTNHKPDLSAISGTGGLAGNHNLKIYGNTITDVNMGIVAVGPGGAADYAEGLDIGGASLATGNTLTNFGTSATYSAYPSVNAAANCTGIYIRYTNNYNVSYNSLTSSNGGMTSGTFRGIFINNFVNAPLGTITNTINNNDISLLTGNAAGTIHGILVDVNTLNATTTVNVNNNNFKNMGFSTASTGVIDMIRLGNTNVFPDAVFNVKNNTFTNLSLINSGSTTLINDQYSLSSTVEGNAIVGTFARTGSGGTFWCYLNNGSQTGGKHIVKNNTFSNITLAGITAFFGIRSTGGSSPVQAVEVSGNTISNVIAGSGNAIGIQTGYEKTGSFVTNNIVKDITGTGNVTGVIIGTSSAAAPGTVDCSSNTIGGLKTIGAFAVKGIWNTAAATNNIFNNKIYNIEANNATGTVDGIQVNAGTTVNVYNNIVGDLRTPLANAANPLVGINISGGTTVNVDYNTVALNAVSSGALFGSSAVLVNAPTTVTFRNNIFSNNSSITGAGIAAAHRRVGTALTSYAATSNNNLFNGSTIFTDGTNTDVTLAAYKTRMTPRETASIAENPTFVSTVGTDATFLHINTAVATAIEGGAMVIAITTDFDGNARNASTPDIGADEFAGVTLGFESFDAILLTVYPTLVKDKVTITYKEPLSEVKVFNISGQQMLSKKINENEAQIEMANLSKGVYFIQVNAGNTTKTIKVIKQ
ncbi:T9SS type A sorting domain-containing protein [Flavobacterium sp.]|jgi:hypothetical protein|uniref:T9SS type A sorting domain-containing protein n=1 Tax=Flavobacterium sp. TaxID=239 RepID=UPI0037BE4EF3